MNSERTPFESFSLLSRELNAPKATDNTVIKSTKKYNLFLKILSKTNGEFSIRKLIKFKKDFIKLPEEEQKGVIQDLWKLQTGDIVSLSDIKQHQGVPIPVWLIEVLQGQRCVYGMECRDKHKKRHKEQFKLH